MKYWRKPLDTDAVKVPHGEIHLIRELCKGCGFCVEYCPRKVLEISEGYNKKGYHTPAAVNPEACVSCGLCELICPEFAIYVKKLEESPSPEPAKGTPQKSEV
ncbi:MAG TPA: 4Fe-4S binding protein [bacterium]|nr:4Fe-4S binding protein [bacterium]